MARIERERRAHVRVPFGGTANVTTMGGDCRGAIVDLSRGGIAVRGERGPRIGEFVRLRFGVPDGGAVLWVDPDAIVVRETPSGNGTLWALKFMGLTTAHDEGITKYVATKQTGSPTDRLRAGTRTERNAAIQQLLAGRPRAAATTPRPISGGSPRVDPAELQRRARRNAEASRSVPSATIYGRPRAPDPVPKPAGARELANLFRAAVADLDASKLDKKKR